MIGTSRTLALAAFVAGMTLAFEASAQTEVNVVAFAPGFAWANLFGASGTEKTEELLAFEKKEGITVNMEYADEETARQKVLLDLVNGTGKYDLVMLGSDGAVQTYCYCRLSRAARRLSRQGQGLFRRRPRSIRSSSTPTGSTASSGRCPIIRSAPASSTARTSSTNTASPSFPKTTDDLEKALKTIKDGLAKDGITDMYALTMRGAPGEEPSLDLAGFVYAYAGYPGLVRRRRRDPGGDQGEEGASRSSPATSRTASRPSCAGRRNSVRRASPPTPGST